MTLLPPWSGCGGIRLKGPAAVVALVLASVAAQPGLMAQTPAPVIEKLSPQFGTSGHQRQDQGLQFRDFGNGHLQHNLRIDYQLGK